MNREEIDVMAGRCLIELGEPKAAEPLLARAIASYNVDHAREVGLYLSWLAEAYLGTGELDAARSTLARARKNSSAANSTRLDRRIAEVEALKRPR